jgi:hypothetical protein
MVEIIGFASLALFFLLSVSFRRIPIGTWWLGVLVFMAGFAFVLISLLNKAYLLFQYHG